MKLNLKVEISIFRIRFALEKDYFTALTVSDYQ